MLTAFVKQGESHPVWGVSLSPKEVMSGKFLSDEDVVVRVHVHGPGFIDIWPTLTGGRLDSNT